MLPSKYEPGNPPDDDYCDIHENYLRPCRVCRAEALIYKAEERYQTDIDPGAESK